MITGLVPMLPAISSLVTLQSVKVTIQANIWIAIVNLLEICILSPFHRRAPPVFPPRLYKPAAMSGTYISASIKKVYLKILLYTIFSKIRIFCVTLLRYGSPAKGFKIGKSAVIPLTILSSFIFL